MGNILEVLKLIDKYNDAGKNIIKLSEEIIILLKNILLYKTVDNYFEENENITLYETLENNIEVSKLITLIDNFNDSLPKLKQSNDPKLILELLIIKYVSDLKKSKGSNISVKKLSVEKTKELIIKNKEVASKTNLEPQESKVTDIQTEPKQEENQVEIKTVEQKNVVKENNKILEKLEEVKKIRVNNTLSAFNKKLLSDLKNDLDNIRDMLLIPEYSEFVSTILDGSLKAASDKNLIFVFETETLANYFNENLLIIEEILEKNYCSHYDVIAVDNISWEIIKKEFNSKTKQYIYQEEIIKIKELLNVPESKDELNDLFGEIVEIVN